MAYPPLDRFCGIVAIGALNHNPAIRGIDRAGRWLFGLATVTRKSSIFPRYEGRRR